ncbi:ABC transporter permease [Nordella sp. HKS 07]|uniref:ABC transporter permease n=1 Tax=Nordella sp. HKS 07 TaxID=2712222 RepID=UPI0013E11482|nr:ABC transporter permease [Nordella sp. HKS 07]QIG49067.1 ABC transporter permease [Nordella sp. HKS 07]
MARFMQFLFVTKTVWAVLLALLAGSVLILVAGANPIEAYRSLFGEAFFDYYGFGATLVKFSPILLAGLAVAIPLQAGLFNVGAEGQIYMGALFCAIAALYLPEMYWPLHLLICTLAGAAGGAFWAAIAGYLKAYRGINEVIVTLLLNYVGINIVSYAAGGPMMEEGAPYPYSAEIPSGLFLPHIMNPTDAHIGAIVGVLLAIALALALKYTTFGFAITTVGSNPQAARYAGIFVQRQMVATMALGGALAGLAGAFEILGVKYRLFHMFSPGYGFDGIVVAFMAAANPILVPISALFFSGLRSGAQFMQRAVGVDSTVIDAIQGLVVIFVAASLAIKFSDSRWGKILARRRAMEAAVTLGEKQNA